MGRSAVARWARAALAAGAAGVCLLTAGCTSVDASDMPRPPVMDLLDVEQQPYDLLPPGSPALLVTVPGSSRMMGGTGLYEFFIARGVSTPYCVVAVDIYHAQVGHACGGDVFGGELGEGLRFEFGAFFARAIPNADGHMTLNSHFVVTTDVGEFRFAPELEQLLARPQVPTDILPFADGSDMPIDSMRLLATDGNTTFYVSYGSRPGAAVCLSNHTDTGDGSAWGGGGCGMKDVVLNVGHSYGGTFSGLKAHFSAAGFEGETPDGWRQVTPLLRVQGPGDDSAQLFRVPTEDAEPLHP